MCKKLTFTGSRTHTINKATQKTTGIMPSTSKTHPNLVLASTGSRTHTVNKATQETTGIMPSASKIHPSQVLTKYGKSKVKNRKSSIS